MTSYEPVIGLEIHAQLLTASKIFCGCSASFGAPPNQHTCPVCLGMPVGLQIVGPPFGEEVVLRAARAFEAATEWHRLRPPDLAERKPPA